MKKVKAFKDGNLVSLIRAEAVTEETRYGFDYRCIENACDCKMHWRKAVAAKGNTDPRPPTFVKNPSSSHRDNCPGDLERIVRENTDYTTIRNGQIHVRINFPLGSSRIDRYPLRGDLTENFIRAADRQKNIKPYSHIRDLVKFIEKNFGSLDSESAQDIVVNYQGKFVEWSKLFKGSDQYDRLYVRAKNYKDDGSTPPIMTIVRPLKEIDPNDQGKRRFVCEQQNVKIDGRRQKVTPIIVCDLAEPALVKKLEYHVKQKSTMIVTARPFHAGAQSIPSRFGDQRVSLLIHKMEQIDPVASTYWKPSQKPENQFNLFPQGPIG